MFGHHPYISNGKHGNAGVYDGSNIGIQAGVPVKEFFETAICNSGVDVYLAGHEHTRQWLEPQCGVEFIVSGAAAKTEPLEGYNPTFFETDQLRGFLLVEIDGNSFAGSFYDENAELEFTRTVTK